MNQNKKGPNNQTLARKLTVWLKVAFAIFIASSLYNNGQQRAIMRKTEAVQNSVDAMRDSVEDLQKEIYAIHEHLALNQNSADKYHFETFNACDSGSTFKSWMDYKTITDKSSKQFELQKNADTDQNGMRNTFDRLHIAIANFEVGDMLNIHLNSGEVLNTLVADIKSTSCAHPDGSVIEFLVDSNEMESKIKQSGNYNDIFTGTISRIERVGNHFTYLEN